MDSAIIAGTGIYEIPGLTLEAQIVCTDYGEANINIGRVDGFEIAFLARHGLDHTTPPHKINYRANIKALEQLGVKYILATNAVGSISREIPPMSLSLVTDFLDFTSNRPLSFYEGGKTGLAHTNMDDAYCPALRSKILQLAPAHGLKIQPQSVYVAANGPRFETPAEIRMYAQLGGEIVGMTGVPEVVLARELGMHYAAIAYSINWAAGVEKEMTFVSSQMDDIRKKIGALLVHTVQEKIEFNCNCEHACMMMHPPEKS